MRLFCSRDLLLGALLPRRGLVSRIPGSSGLIDVLTVREDGAARQGLVAALAIRARGRSRQAGQRTHQAT